MTSPTPRTVAEISASLRQDPVIERVVPSWAFRSIPVPVMQHGLPCILYFFYPAKGKAGEPKNIYPPLTQVLVAIESGKVVQVVSAPLFWPPGQTPDQAIGQYPGQSLCGLSLKETDALYQEYYSLCDRLLINLPFGRVVESPVYPDWFAAFSRLKEDGFSPYYAPFMRQQVPAPPHREPTTTRHETSARSASPTNELPPQQHSRQHIDVQAHLHAAKLFLVNAGLNDLLPLWREVAARREAEYFSTAVIGEFSRGKSTLLNRLIGENLLPVGELPTTAILTRICHGTRRSGCRILSSKTKQELAVSTDVLGQFIADSEGKDPEGVLQVELPNQWLSDNSIVLYDTPGAADLTGRRAALTVEAITRCDSAIVVINATMPCSLTEMEFIHDHVVAKRTPMVAGTLSKLDLIPPGERRAVISHVSLKLRELSPSIKLWSVHGPEEIPEIKGSEIVCAGPDAIRSRLSAWAADPDMQALRDLQSAAQLQRLLQYGVDILANQLDAARLTKEEQVKLLQNQKIIISQSRLGWDDIQVALDKKALETEQMIDADLAKIAPDLAEDLRQLLSRTQNPKAWWEQDFPYQLRRQVRAFSGSFCRKVEQRLVEHGAWLNGEVNTRFSLSAVLKPVPFKSDDNLTEPITRSPCLPDFDRKRIHARIGLLGVTAASYMLLGPLAIAVTGGLAIWSETTLKHLIDNQKLTSRSAVDASVDEVLGTLRRRLNERTRDWYKAMFAGIQQEALRWQTAQMAAIEKGASISRPDVSRIEALLEQARRQTCILKAIMEGER